MCVCVCVSVFFANPRGRSMLNNLYLIEPVLNPVKWLLRAPSCWPHCLQRQETLYCLTNVPTTQCDNTSTITKTKTRSALLAVHLRLRPLSDDYQHLNDMKLITNNVVAPVHGWTQETVKNSKLIHYFSHLLCSPCFV